MELSEIRKNGIFYTPSDLAELLVKPLIKNNGQKIFDPSYGEGSLLLAAEKISKAKKASNKPKIFGCDTKPVNGLLSHLPEANLKKSDFFKFSTVNKFDVILMNPPYVRHHFQDGVLIDQYRKRYPDLKILNLKSDLWAYFLLKATMHLNHNGDLGAILPWSFIQADYSKEVRKWLFNSFENITVLGLNNKYFDSAEARIVLLWLTNYGLRNKSIKIGSSRSISIMPIYRNVDKNKWSSEDVIYSETGQIDRFLSDCKKRYGYNELSHYCDVKIGVVTGADDFFLMEKSMAKTWNFSKKHLIPIISNSKQFNEVLLGKFDQLKSLICLTPDDHRIFRKFVKHGENLNFHLREHSKRRKPWFCVNPGSIPDAFFPYRTVKFPYILSNDKKIQCTNSVHRLYFKDLSSVEIKWIQISLLSSIGQLSLEAEAKTYGKMMLKIEPRCLKNAMVYSCTDNHINTVHDHVYEKLRNNDKEGAMIEATTFMNRYLKVSERDAKNSIRLLKRLQQFRLGN